MSSNLSSKIFVAIAVVVAGAAAAHYCSAAPPGCSPSDQKLISSYVHTAVEALVDGDLQQYGVLTQELEAKLSPTCKADLAKSQPMKVKCTVKEKEVILSHYEAIMEAAYQGDLNRVFRGLEDLEESVSSQCWKALNYPQDTQVQQACSSSELDLFASAAGPLTRATERMLTTGELSEILELAQDLNAKLSPACGAAWTAAQRKAQDQRRGTSGGTPYAPPAVLDHGGGTYSVTGVGACTPSGCMAF